MRQSSATDLGDAFVTALVDGDAPRLAGTLAPDVQMRALIPPGPIEVLGAEAVAGKFAAWFGNAEQLQLMRSGSDAVADRWQGCFAARVAYQPILIRGTAIRKDGNTNEPRRIVKGR